MLETLLISPPATFGFFDLDGLFSVAFVLILAKLVPFEPQRAKMANGIELTMKLFNYLAKRGNKAALNRKADFEQMCNHAGIALEGTYASPGGVQEIMTLHSHAANTLRYGPVTDSAQATVENPSRPESLETSSLPSFWQPENILFDSFFYSVPDDFYTVYQNVDLTLSGSVELDWGQLESNINSFHGNRSLQ